MLLGDCKCLLVW